MVSDAQPKLLLKEKQAASFLSISPRKLWGLAKEGRIKRVKIDGCVRYDVDELQAFIQRTKNPPAQQSG